MNQQKPNSKPHRRDLPTDIEPGEEELIEAFDRWVHEKHPNPERVGCPGRLALAELVVTDTKFEDEYTLKHISQCAACVDDITELRLEFKRMKEIHQTGASDPA